MQEFSIKKLVTITLVFSFFLMITPQAEAKIYIDDEYRFWIEYPSNWWFEDTQVEIEPIPGINDGTVIFPSFRDGVQYWYQFTSVTLIKNSTIVMNYDGQQFFDVIINDLKNGCMIASFDYEGYVCSNYNVTDTKILEINGMKAYQIMDTWIEKYPDGLNFTKKSIVTDFVVKNDLWQIDSIIVESKAEIDEIKEIPYSFRFLDDSEYFPDSMRQKIPEWIKNNAGWWASGQIDDDSFVQGIQFMIKEKIIQITIVEPMDPQESIVPEWVKNNAGWWAEGTIPDGEFISALQFLIKEGIIKV